MQYVDGDRVIDVFQELHLEIQSGGNVAIIGESGVGKTTLLYILGGLEQASKGKVYMDGTCMSDLVGNNAAISQFRGQHFGFIFQSHYLFQEFDAEENVAMPLLLQGVSMESARERAKTLLRRVGLEKRMTHRPGMLSGGEQQRVAIARALAARPGVVLADEPTGNLDIKTGAMINDLLLEIHRQEKATLVVVTHSQDLARKMDRVVELTPSGFVVH